MKPLMFGYQVARLNTSAQDLHHGRLILQAFADREGYALKEVFVERDVNRPCSAMSALIAATKDSEVRAIAVPSAQDLGLLPRVQYLTRRRLERETALPVLVLTPIRK